MTTAQTSSPRRWRRTPLLLSLVTVGATAGCTVVFGGADDVAIPVDPPVILLPRCAPAAVSPASTVAPELRRWILEAEAASTRDGCALAARTSAGSTETLLPATQAFAPPGTRACDARGCWRALPALVRAWQAPASSPFRGEDEAWIGTIQAARHEVTGELRATLEAMHFGSTARQRFERRWDRDGNLLHEEVFWNDTRWSAVDQEWQDGRLVRADYVDDVDGTGWIRSRWDYQGADLVAARSERGPDPLVLDSQFRRDGAGRLIEVTRTRDGAAWATQTWSYDGPRVTSYATTLALSARGGTLSHPSDDLMPILYAEDQRAWDAAAGWVPTGSCAPLPHGLVAGYPEVDGGYALGWAQDDRPDGIDQDYGFGGVYDTAEDRWYGHDGVEAYVAYWPRTEGTVQATVQLDAAGRMTDEALVDLGAGVVARRQRRFVDGRLVTDVRTLAPTAAATAPQRSELAFVYGADGALVERTHHVDGVLVARHGWQRDDAGAIAHRIEARAVAAGEYGQALTPYSWLTPAPAAGLTAAVVHRRAPVGPAQRWWRDGVLTQDRTVDDRGRLLALTSYQGGAEAGRIRWRYDGDLLLERADGLDPATGTLLRVLVSGGRIVERTYRYGTSGAVDRFTYSCP